MPRKAELQILNQIVDTIARNHRDLPSDELTGFMAMIGQSYRGELMVVGRAVNGWSKGFTPVALTSAVTRQDFIANVLESVSGESSCPMRWVSSSWGDSENYNTARSAFWRVIRGVVSALNLADIEDPAWPSCLIWSNLYKIAPAAGGNPSATLCSLQFGDCISLLNEEYRTYRPKRILFLTGIDWAEPFVKSLAQRTSVGTGKRYLQAISKSFESEHEESAITVAVHPQGCPGEEACWLEEVVAALRP